ncbi:MAG: beta-lactamase family protein [Comamonadaceae bacterium]|nr:beta-lactamase family protein [Comamonadaceae bacterium]
MAKPKTLAAALILAAVALAASCANGGRDDGGDIAARMDAYLTASHGLDRFSGSVLVARGGQIVLRKGYGMANYELSVPNGPETKFRLGSITKQFTAMAILQLESQGKLAVSDTVETVFPGFPNGGRITIRHLLTHTSGLPNMTEFPDYAKTMALPSTALETVGRFKDLPLDFEPGERLSYSNSGYVLLGAIIEKVAGRSYEEFVRENIFRPLGMDDTGYDHPDAILKNRASGYEFADDRLANARYIDMTIPHAAGGLTSTVDDLYKWDRALYTDKLLPRRRPGQAVRAVQGELRVRLVRRVLSPATGTSVTAAGSTASPRTSPASPTTTRASSSSTTSAPASYRRSATPWPAISSARPWRRRKGKRS